MNLEKIKGEFYACPGYTDAGHVTHVTRLSSIKIGEAPQVGLFVVSNSIYETEKAGHLGISSHTLFGKLFLTTRPRVRRLAQSPPLS